MKERGPDRHHPYFQRSEQCKTKVGRYLISSIVIPMDYETHHFELHENCEKMPIFERPTLEVVAAYFNPVENPIETIDILMRAFSKAEKSERIKYSQKILAGIAIENLAKQIPYIKYGRIK